MSRSKPALALLNKSLSLKIKWPRFSPHICLLFSHNAFIYGTMIGLAIFVIGLVVWIANLFLLLQF